MRLGTIFCTVYNPSNSQIFCEISNLKKRKERECVVESQFLIFCLFSDLLLYIYLKKDGTTR